MLDFQHVIQVNDLDDDTAPVLERSELWQGLVLRAREPQRFNTSVQCVSSVVQDNQFIRQISAGAAKFEEQVVLTPELKIETTTVAGLDQIFAHSSALIEEPEPNSLFVRFRYQRDLEAGDQQVQVAEYLKSAYVQLDQDAIVMIRMLAQRKSLANSID